MTLTITTLVAGQSLVKRKPKPFRNLAGETFGRLTVLSRADHPLRPIHWRCACSCGTERVVNGKPGLTRGDTRSCGCLRSEMSRTRMLRTDTLRISSPLLNSGPGSTCAPAARTRRTQVSSRMAAGASPFKRSGIAPKLASRASLITSD
jgi:hypothetical protein